MAQSSVRIVTELHDEPHIAGRRVTVRRIQGLVEGAGQSAAEVAAELDLDIAAIDGTFQYYHSHPEEMDAAERQRAEHEATARNAEAVSLAELKRSDTQSMEYRVLVDENTSPRVVETLRDDGYTAAHIHDVLLEGVDDDTIVEFARKNRYIQQHLQVFTHAVARLRAIG